MEQLVGLEKHAGGDYESPLRMPLYTVPLEPSKDWPCKEFKDIIFIVDKSEVLSSSSEVARLSISNEVFEQAIEMNTCEELTEIEGMIINRVTHERLRDKAMVKLEELRHSEKPGSPALVKAEKALKEANDHFERSRVMRFSRRDTLRRLPSIIQSGLSPSSRSTGEGWKDDPPGCASDVTLMLGSIRGHRGQL